jgi:aryl-alcohol dehydrogenase-like predicted oxidoreductase
MQCGLLTGKITRERVASFPKDDFRRKDGHFIEPVLSNNLKRVEGLKQLAAQAGRTPAQLAIAWVLHRPEITSAIVGARSAQQIEETIKAGNLILSPDEIQALETLFPSSSGHLS